MFHFYTHWKHQRTGGFLMLLGDIEVEHSLEMINPFDAISLFLSPSENNRKSEVY